MHADSPIFRSLLWLHTNISVSLQMSVQRDTSLLARRKIIPLTSIRGIAALLIVSLHLVTIDGIEPIFTHNLRSVVSLFFLLSGFMLVWCYHHCDLDSWRCKGAFMLRRIARLYPTFIIAYLLSMTILKLNGGFQDYWFQAWTAPLLIFSLVGCNVDNVQRPFVHHWAVSLEFLFYVTFFFTFPYIQKFYRKSITKGSHSAWWWSFWVAAPISLYVWSVAPVLEHYNHNTTTDCRIYFLLPYRLPECYLGVWAGYYALHYLHPAWSRASSVTVKMTGLLIDISIASIAVVVVYLVPVFSQTYFNLIGYFETGMLAPVGAAVILMLSLDVGWIATLFHWRPLELLGEISYEIYMLHVFTADTVAWLGPIYQWPLHRDHLFPISLPFTLLLSYFLAHWYSQPLFSYIVSYVTGKYPRMVCACSKRDNPTPLISREKESRTLISSMYPEDSTDETIDTDVTILLA